MADATEVLMMAQEHLIKALRDDRDEAVRLLRDAREYVVEHTGDPDDPESDHLCEQIDVYLDHAPKPEPICVQCRQPMSAHVWSEGTGPQCDTPPPASATSERGAE